MKKITLITLLFSVFGFSQNGPIDFETGGNGATWTWNVFENDSNPALEFVANPNSAGNSTSTVAKFTALQTGNPWAGCESAHGSPLGTFDLSSSNAIIKIWVYKPVISDVGIKLVTPTGGAQPEKKVANTLINQWEELTFDFTNYIGLGETTGLDQIVVFPDYNLSGRTQNNICYFDQITFSAATPAPTGPELPLTFESSTLTYTFTDFGGAITTKVANPDATGGNTSATVARTVKGASGAPSETWAGSFIELGSPIDFSNSQIIKIKTWSPQAGITVRLKLENLANGAIFVEQDATTTVANAWEELTFTFAGIVNANNYQKVVVFFDFGTAQSGTTYYFDDVILETTANTSLFNFSKIKLYPNPANNVLNIQAGSNVQSVSVYNILGQEVLNRTLNNTTATIDISSLNIGVYVIKALIDGNVVSSKFIKE